MNSKTNQLAGGCSGNNDRASQVVVKRWRPAQAHPDDRAQLGFLLRKCVEGGASIGFMLPLGEQELESYWTKVLADPATTRCILIAREVGGTIVGSAQLALETRRNGQHRAEVQKVMVLPEWRREKIGARLMAQLERLAVEENRSLLYLDTSVGESGAVHFYEELGYVLAGGIPDYAQAPGGGMEANAIYFKKIVQ